MQLLNPAARDLLARLRPMAIVREQAGAAEANNSLWAGPRYTTHPLVREVAAEMLASRDPEDRMQACRAFARFMLSCGDKMKHMAETGLEAQVTTQELLGIELVNFRELARLVAEPALNVLSLQHSSSLVRLAALLWDIGYLVVAAELGRATLKALRHHDHLVLSHAQSCLGKMLTHEGTLDQAEKLARNTLAGLKARPGLSHADTVSALENLALTLQQRERMQLSAKFKTLPPPYAGLPHCSLRDTGHDSTGESEPLISTLVHVDKGTAPPFLCTHVEDVMKCVVSSWQCLCHALCCCLLWRSPAWQDACFEADLGDAVQTHCCGVRHYGERHSRSGAPMTRGGRAFQTCRPSNDSGGMLDAEHDEVITLQRAVLRARGTQLGSEHLDTIFARANLAATLRHRGQLDEAAELLCDVLAAQVKVLGEGHPDAVRTRAELSDTLEQL